MQVSIKSLVLTVLAATLAANTGQLSAHGPTELAVAAAALNTEQTPQSVLFRNVRVFDGVSGQLSVAQDVLVHGNHIERIGLSLSSEPGTQVIEGVGRVLMPGLIDAHWHSMMASAPITALKAPEVRYLTAIAAAESGTNTDARFYYGT